VGQRHALPFALKSTGDKIASVTSSHRAWYIEFDVD